MNKDNKNIDWLINSKLDDYSKKPANYVWGNIASALDAKAKSRKRALALWSSLAAAVMLAFIGGFLLGNLKYKTKITDSNNSGTLNGRTVNKFGNIALQNALEETAKLSVESFTKPDNRHTKKSAHRKDLSTPAKMQFAEKIQKKAPGNKTEHTLIATEAIKDNLQNSSSKRPTTKGNKHIKQSELVELLPNNNLTINNLTITNSKELLSVRNANKSLVQLNNTQQTQYLLFSLQPALLSSVSSIVLPVSYNTRLSFSAWFNPYYVFRNASRNENNYASIYGNNAEFVETTHFSYAAGISIGYEVVNNLSIGLGVGYNTFTHSVSRNNLQTKNLKTVLPEDPDYLAIQTSAGSINQVLYYHNLYNANSFGPFINAELDNGDVIENIVQTFSYVEVPIFVKYRVGKKVGVDLTASVNPAFLTKNKVVIDGQKRNYFYGKTQDISSFHLNARIGAEVFIRFNRLISIYGGPSFKYSLTNWSNNPGIKMHPYYIGGRIGLMMHF